MYSTYDRENGSNYKEMAVSRYMRSVHTSISLSLSLKSRSHGENESIVSLEPPQFAVLGRNSTALLDAKGEDLTWIHLVAVDCGQIVSQEPRVQHRTTRDDLNSLFTHPIEHGLVAAMQVLKVTESDRFVSAVWIRFEATLNVVECILGFTVDVDVNVG